MKVTASRLNVRSGPGTDFRLVGALVQGDDVAVVETSGDWAWVGGGAAEGWVARSFLDSASALLVPKGMEGILRAFGPPGSPPCSAGRASLPAKLKLSWSRAAVSRFACHILLEGVFTETFARIRREGFWSKLENFGGCYADRAIGAGKKRSTHAWGIAVDLNTTTNAQGTAGDMSPDIVRIFEAEGFLWGGSWEGRSRDPMHFQFAEGY